MKIRWLQAATVNLRLIQKHIAAENPEAARRIIKAIRYSSVRLGEFPGSGHLGTVTGTRELIIPNLRYVIVYREMDDCVEILRVFHTAMNWHEGWA